MAPEHPGPQVISLIDFVVISTDLHYVLDTRVKRGAELSTDQHLVVSWICCRGRRLEKPGRPKHVMRVCHGDPPLPQAKQAVREANTSLGGVREGHGEELLVSLKKIQANRPMP